MVVTTTDEEVDCTIRGESRSSCVGLCLQLLMYDYCWCLWLPIHSVPGVGDVCCFNFLL
jgi:hypothetical protein